MVDEPRISNTHRVTNSDAVSARQPFRNLYDISAWFNVAMIDRSLISNTHGGTNSGEESANGGSQLDAFVGDRSTNPQDRSNSAYTLALLETIVDRLEGLLAINHAANSSVPIDINQAYSRKEAASLLRVSTWTVDRARKQGLLVEARRVGKRDVRITGESLLNFMSARESAPVRVRSL